MITEKSSVGFVMDLLAPVGWELLSRMGISTLWRVVRCSPFAWIFSFRNVALVASAFRMLFSAASAGILDVSAASLSRSMRCSCLRCDACWWHSSSEKRAAWRQLRE